MSTIAYIKKGKFGEALSNFPPKSELREGESLYHLVFQAGEMIKEAFIEAAESLFREFKNKPET